MWECPSLCQCGVGWGSICKVCGKGVYQSITQDCIHRELVARGESVYGSRKGPKSGRGDKLSSPYAALLRVHVCLLLQLRVTIQTASENQKGSEHEREVAEMKVNEVTN